MNYYSRIDRVAAQIGKVSHMQAQFTQSDTIAGMISKSNTFMQSAIGLIDYYNASPYLLHSLSGATYAELEWQHCSSTRMRTISAVSLQNQLLPVVSGDISGMETDPLEPALYYYHHDHLGSATWITDSVGNPAQFLHVALWTHYLRNAALVSMGVPRLVLVNIREKGKSQGDRPNMVDIWRLREPLSESYSDVIDVESTVCHR